MHRSLSAAVLAAMLGVTGVIAATGPPEAIGSARALLERNEVREAIALLEDTLPEAAADRPAVLDLLRQAYAVAARQAEAEGKAAEAEAYRDNLEILNRNPKPAAKPAPSDSALQKASADAISTPAEAIPPARVEATPVFEPVETASSPAPEPEAALAPKSAAVLGKAATRAQIAAADKAFVEQSYKHAGQIYQELDKTRRLPVERRDHLAYCLLVEVKDRINAQPKDSQEWAQIDATVQKIRALSPNKWFGEYVRDLVAERSSARKASKSNKLVVRGSAPDEPAPGLLANSARTGPLLAIGPQPPDPSQSPGPRREQPKAEPAQPGRWQVCETANFRVLHNDPALAEKVARAAEATREAQTKRWAGAPPREPWSPRCDIYLYPNAQVFSRMTGQPEDSPGFSTMGMNSGKIIARRVNLRADHPNLLDAILPHEVTHVVLADLFPERQIARWADEGIAVLSEPSAEQRTRAADLDEPLSSGRLFRVQDLMVMDYPSGQHWSLYYAQSVSLTRYLVEQGTPARFVEFVQGAQQRGTEVELRRVYKIEGFADLQKRWLDYARSNTSSALAATGGDKPQTRE